jgi:hypothetical protein
MSNDKADATYHPDKKPSQKERAYGTEPIQTQSDRNPNKGGELGPVGKVVLSVVALAIVIPFIGILWAWAIGVIQGMGGLW